MGYTTDFYGKFTLNKPLTEAHAAYLNAFAGSRRMKRYPDLLPDDPLRKAVDLPPGPEGAFFVGAADSDFGQDRHASIVNYNAPPVGQPGLWCQWVPTHDRTGIEWDGGEKFYDYVEWLAYLIRHFLAPWGYVLSGEVTWAGEDRSDHGQIVVVDNVIGTRTGRVVYEDD